MLPIFIFDQDILEGLKDKADKRVAFIHKALTDIQTTLKENGSSLYILHDTPQQAFAKLTKEFDITAIYTNHDYEPYAIGRDTEVKKSLETKASPYTLSKTRSSSKEMKSSKQMDHLIPSSRPFLKYGKRNTPRKKGKIPQ